MKEADPIKHTNCRSREQSGGIIFTLLILILVLALLATGLFFVSPDLVSANIPFFEKSPPTLELVDPPVAVGLDVNEIYLDVTDLGAGLDEVVVRLTQGSREAELLKKEFSSTDSSAAKLKIEINAKELGLHEGEAKLSILAFDRSFWNNRAELQKSLRILFSRPRLEVLTAQHNVAQGGTGLAFYRLTAGEIVKSGVQVGKDFFPGYPARELDSVFGGSPSVYFAFFAIPKKFDSNREKIQAVAFDIASNMAKVEPYSLVLKRNFKDVAMTLSSDFLRRKLPDLLPGYYVLSGDPVPAIDTETASEDDLIKMFRTVNEDYRALLNKKIAEITSKPVEKKLWEGPFIRPVLGAPTSAYGENRSYSYNGKSAGGSAHDGIDLAAVANAPVCAANSGRVIYTDDLGIYGNTVIIDHGFGITSLYGHLSSISVNPGDDIEKSTQIGRSGTTGLAGGDHLHFELRINAQPITPIEWWDGKWVKDHMENKIAGMAAQVGTLP